MVYARASFGLTWQSLLLLSSALYSLIFPSRDCPCRLHPDNVPEFPDLGIRGEEIPMSYRVWILLLLLSTNCYSQETVRPSDKDRFGEFSSESQLMRSLSQPTNVRTYSAPGGPG